MDVKEARNFLKSVREHAKNMSQNATAKAMQLNITTFNARLIKAITILKENIPDFAQGKGRIGRKESSLKVQPSGRGGKSKKIAIPQHVFTEMGWDIGDSIKVKTYGKKKVTITKSNQED